MIERVLVIGATGMLARPVIRRLVSEGYRVRALVRSPEKARTLLPGEVEVVPGDLQDPPSITAALDGIEGVYLNLSSPSAPHPFDPVRDGTRTVVEAVRQSAVRRIGIITSQGVCPEAESWWNIACKARAEEAVRSSGISYTIFRPTWFMESLPLMVQGRRVLVPRMPGVELFWIAGDDYGRQVAAAFRSDTAENKTYVIQGPEALSFDGAVRRFVTAYDPALRIKHVPLGILRVGGWFNSELRFLRALMIFTRDHHLGFHATAAWRELGEPVMRIEDYVRYAREHAEPLAQ